MTTLENFNKKEEDSQKESYNTYHGESSHKISGFKMFIVTGLIFELKALSKQTKVMYRDTWGSKMV